MKYIHITKNELIYKKVDLTTPKYTWLFYLLKIIYPIWIIIGLFTFKPIYFLLSLLGLIKFFIYPLIKGKTYRIYELIDALINILLYIYLIFT
jgi:hypothetical protein